VFDRVRLTRCQGPRWQVILQLLEHVRETLRQPVQMGILYDR
jgi:hypothetical protein